MTVKSFCLCGESMAATAAAAAFFFFKPNIAAIVNDLAPAEPPIVSNCVSPKSALDFGGDDDDGGIDEEADAALRIARKFDK